MKRLVLIALLLAGCERAHIGAHAIDGDTFKDGGQRYRIAAIDAPELPGHCRRGRNCVDGDPYASMRALQWFLDHGVSCRKLGSDRYGRTLVNCRVFGEEQDLGETLINLGFAERWPR